MKRIAIMITIAFICLTGCSTNQLKVTPATASAPVPTGSIENLENDMKEYVKIFSGKANKLEPITDEEKKTIDAFIGKYYKNPRLNGDQQNRVNMLESLNTVYDIYLKYKDSKDVEQIKISNDAVKSFFDTLQLLKREGYTS